MKESFVERINAMPVAFYCAEHRAKRVTLPLSCWRCSLRATLWDSLRDHDKARLSMPIVTWDEVPNEVWADRRNTLDVVPRNLISDILNWTQGTSHLEAWEAQVVRYYRERINRHLVDLS